MPGSMQDNVTHPWAAPADEIERRLGADRSQGLSAEEASRRLQQFGPNRLQRGKGTTRLKMFLRQFADVMIGLLAAAAVVSALIHEWRDAILIGIIVLANAVIGFLQEWRAEKAVEALQALSQPLANVRRDGRLSEIPAAEVVPGDLIEFSGGDFVPADARLFEAASLEVDESALTGESLAVEKTVEPLPQNVVLPDRTCMVFSGTAVMKGNGRAFVTATGMNSELGRIATLLSEAESAQTPLQRRLAQLSRRLAVAVVAIALLIFAAGVLREGIGNWNAHLFEEMLLVAVSLAVAAIPEGLPAVITVTLALGSQRMAKRNAIIRRLPAVETLGSVTVICSDKTGTLTQNRMTVAEAIPCDETDESLRRLFTAAVLCNDAEIGADGKPSGSATETAILMAARERGLDPQALRERYPRVDEVAFSSQRKRMTTLHRAGEGFVVWVKGAAEQVVDRCDSLGDRDRERPLEEEAQRRWIDRAHELAGRGRRVLAVARKTAEGPELPEGDSADASLSLLGLIGIVDPVRAEARDAIEECREAGIRPVMITGDHPGTAAAIAEEAGLPMSTGAVLSGAEIDAMSEEQLRASVDRAVVFARVAPEHKLRIVRAYRSHGNVVAMTGDGVNDGPALKQADIGVAMGIAGTDVAKASADMILADDNFATIVAAVEAGRVIYDNIRKFVRYLLTANTGEILLVALAILLGYPIPLLPVHILWINLVTDGLPALALGFESAERNVMQRPPRKKDESLFDREMIRGIVSIGLLMGLASLGVFHVYSATEWFALPAAGAGIEEYRETYARTLTFVVLSMFQLFYVLGVRSNTTLLFERGLLSNWRLLGAVLGGTVLQMAVVYVPGVRTYFHTVPLGFRDLALGLGVATLALLAVEGRKIVHRLGRTGADSA